MSEQNNDKSPAKSDTGSNLEDICLPARLTLSSPIRFSSIVLAALLVAPLGTVWADDNEAASAAAAVAGEVAHKQKLRGFFPDPTASAQPTPPVIPQLQMDADASGMIATFQPSGPTQTANNAFFQNLGSNGRSCFTCHQPQDGW